MNQVDRAAATAKGIPIRNVPDYCVDEVSDHALMLLLAAARRLPTLMAIGARYDWRAKHLSPVKEIRRLRGQTLGVIGAGRIGRRVAAKARAFGFQTIAFDPYLLADPDPDLQLLALDIVLERSDALVLCAALTETSSGMIDRRALNLVRPGVVLVNVARGGLVDETALAEALERGVVSVAALDVRAIEPPREGVDALAAASNIIRTPHVAGWSKEALQDLHRMGAEAALGLLNDAGVAR